MVNRFSLTVYFADGGTARPRDTFRTLAEANAQAALLIAAGGIESVATVDRRLTAIGADPVRRARYEARQRKRLGL